MPFGFPPASSQGTFLPSTPSSSKPLPPSSPPPSPPPQDHTSLAKVMTPPARPVATLGLDYYTDMLGLPSDTGSSPLAPQSRLGKRPRSHPLSSSAPRSSLHSYGLHGSTPSGVDVGTCTAGPLPHGTNGGLSSLDALFASPSLDPSMTDPLVSEGFPEHLVMFDHLFSGEPLDAASSSRPHAYPHAASSGSSAPPPSGFGSGVGAMAGEGEEDGLLHWFDDDLMSGPHACPPQWQGPSTPCISSLLELDGCLSPSMQPNWRYSTPGGRYALGA